MPAPPHRPPFEDRLPRIQDHAAGKTCPDTAADHHRQHPKRDIPRPAGAPESGKRSGKTRRAEAQTALFCVCRLRRLPRRKQCPAGQRDCIRSGRGAGYPGNESPDQRRLSLGQIHFPLAGERAEGAGAVQPPGHRKSTVHGHLETPQSGIGSGRGHGGGQHSRYVQGLFCEHGP